MRSRAVVVLSVLGFSLVSGGWLLQQGMTEGGRALDRARLFDDVFEHVSQYYVDSVPQSSLYEKAVDGLLHELNDPHSVYLTGDRLRRLTESTTGNYAGVGVQIDVRDGWITVVSALPGTPAARAGLEGGDRIVAIDSVATEGWSSDEASRALRGEDGTRVLLTVERPGVPQRFPVPVTRREIKIPSVQHAVMLEPGTGYIDLTVFSESSAAEIVAGALQDHDRAVVIGRTSYGKGSAQSLFPLAGGGALKLTTALWFTPVGRSINKKMNDDDEEALALAPSEE